MLQIATGKLFTRAVSHENLLRGVIFTNLHLPEYPERAIEGEAFGRIFQTSERGTHPKTLIYEFKERIEAGEGERQLLLSNTADLYLGDMATLLTIGLNGLASTDVDLVRRLTRGERGLAVSGPPSEFVRRVFDREPAVSEAEIARFELFVTHLLGLRRKTYLGVMRSIRTYVTAIHRVADDLDLAYTLMVAAGESLTQDFDGYTTDWSFIVDKKRSAIELALEGAPADVAQRVKNAVISFEHPALARRFQAFVAAHIDPGFFEPSDEGGLNPFGRGDLGEILAEAYEIRSKYVHQLRPLPGALTRSGGHRASVRDGRRMLLTMQGLTRLMRHVIKAFVSRQPTIDAEPYPYLHEQTNISTGYLAPRYWVASTNGDIAEAGNSKLEGFLEELAAVESGQAGATITDVTAVLELYIEKAPRMKPLQRRSYTVMLALFNGIPGVPQIIGTKASEKLFLADMSVACPQTVVAYAATGMPVPWTLAEHQKAFDEYKSKRTRPSGIRFPRLYEAAIALDLAERHRASADPMRAAELIVQAAEDWPEFPRIRQLIGVDSEIVIAWRNVLIDRAQHAQDASDAAA